MRARSRVYVTAAVVALAGALVYDVYSFATTGDITNFLPGTGSPREVELSRVLARSDLGKTTIAVIRGERAPVIAATKAMADFLSKREDVAWVRSGVGDDVQQAFYELFFPARFGFLSPEPEKDLAAMLSDEGLAKRAATLRDALAGPLGSLVAKTAAADPLLAYTDRLRQLERGHQGRIAVEEGVFLAPDGSGIIFFGSVASPFDAAAQRVLHSAVEDELDAMRRKGGLEVELDLSGLAVLSAHAEETTRDDISRISTVSLVITIALFLGFFRSFRSFLLLFVPVAFGFVFGLAATLAVFSEVHGMTLAFGATLVGVSVDYSVHLIQHHFLHAGHHDRRSDRAVQNGILLGSATTLVGFVAMALTSTPGMQQIAVFGGVGVIAAVVSALIVLPPLLPKLASAPSGLARMHRYLASALTRLEKRRRLIIWIPVAAVGFAVAMLPTAEWNDDPRALVTLDEALVNSDREIRELVSGADPGRFAVASGASAEEALQVNDALFSALESSANAGELGGFDSLHRLLWSQKLQRRNLDVLKSLPALGSRLERIYEAAGFASGAFGPFKEILAGSLPPPVSIDKLAETRLGILVRGFVVEAPSATYVLTRLRGVADAEALGNRVGAIEGAFYFDQGEFIEAAYAGFRRRVLTVVLVSLFAVLAVVSLRYRSAASAVAAFLPAVVAAAVTLAVLAALGVALNLLHVLGLMLVLSIGVDYGVFIVEARKDQADVGSAILGTFVCCATTVVSFTVLAMTENPALSALATSVALGALLSFLLAPLGLVLTRASR